MPRCSRHTPYCKLPLMLWHKWRDLSDCMLHKNVNSRVARHAVADIFHTASCQLDCLAVKELLESAGSGMRRYGGHR